MFSGIMDNNEPNPQASGDQVDKDSNVGTSVGIGVGVGVLLLLLIASILYNLYLRFRIKWRGMLGRGAAATENGELDAEDGRGRGNSAAKETTQIVPSRSRTPGPYNGGADNRNMRATPSRALEKKESNSSAVTQSSAILPPGIEERKVSKVSTVSVGAAPTVPQHMGQGRGDQQQGIRGPSPSPANQMAHDPIYENIGDSHYENFSVTQGQGDGYDDEQNIYEDIPEFGPALAPHQ